MTELVNGPAVKLRFVPIPVATGNTFVTEDGASSHAISAIKIVVTVEDGSEHVVPLHTKNGIAWYATSMVD